MKNALEGAVRSIHRELRGKHPEFCTCERCEDDVLALALNQTKPRYVSEVGSIGSIVTGVHLSYDQLRAELTVLVFDAMRRVAKSPRHDEGAPPPSSR
jgi:competence protein ComFB